MTTTCDVLVLGGGPAGLSTAIRLLALGRSVVVLERSTYDTPRAGETFGGDLAPLLQAIGAWDSFVALGAVPFRGVQASWGGASLVTRESIYNPFGDGWHVDRAAFDATLSLTAERAGVAVHRGVGTPTLARDGDGWRARIATGEDFAARFLVDASGRGAPASAVHLPEARWQRIDREVALMARMSAPWHPVEPVLVLEPTEDGWWYSVPQRDGALLVALMTDADLLPAGGRAEHAKHFTDRLAASVHTADRSAGATLLAAPTVVRSETGYLTPDRGPGWRALGDAAMGCDPLAGDGVVRSLRASAEAAPEIHGALDGGPDGARKPGFLRDYLDMRGRYYLREARWPDAPFWARRRPLDWATAPIFLDPRRPIAWNAPLATPDALAPVEALLPLFALRSLATRLATPTLAHAALGHLRATAPLDDRRLLVALQLLIELGAVTEA